MASSQAWTNLEGGSESSKGAKIVRTSMSSMDSEIDVGINRSASMASMASEYDHVVSKNSIGSVASNGGAEYRPPSASVMDGLDSVLKGQFGELNAIDENDDDSMSVFSAQSGSIEPVESKESRMSKIQETDLRSSRVVPTKIMGLASETEERGQKSKLVANVTNELEQHAKTTCMQRVVEHKYFTIFFMSWTFYALFAVDVDLLCGSKQSRFTLSIVTSVAVILFLFELVCQSLGRKNYFLRAYFWLDAIALLSLLPDTWFVQNMFAADNAFVAGRTSRLTRLIRIASRSSKATRLNRLTRIVRVASLMPRLGNFVGQRVKDDETEKLLEKKLRRVFMFLDEDMDGLIPRSAVRGCLLKMKQENKKEKGAKDRLLKVFTKKLSERKKPAEDLATSHTDTLGATNSGDESPSPSPSPSPRRASPSPSPSFATKNSDPSPKKNFHSRIKTAFSKIATRGMDDLSMVDDFLLADASALVSFKDFREIMMADSTICAKLRRSCRQQVRQGNNMKNLTSRHTETIAVKVALGVLVLLFALGLVEPDAQDKAVESGLEQITSLTKMKFTNHTTEDFIPRLIHDQVAMWTNGVGVDPEKRVVLYLDLEKKGYCNEFVSGGQSCEQSRTSFINWTFRQSIKQIDEDVENSDYRLVDLLPVRVPDKSDDDISDEELDRVTESIAVLYVRGFSQEEAVMSILTTILVIILILSGIVVLTKDLTFLTRNLLKPLRELADDMESIAQLQLAGVSGSEDAVIEEGTSEVRLIRRTFENMKKAIKSWGKYVPWPVVQLLLRANVEANLEVNELEVTIFFSDIASFTTIVESMPPESSLLLLSRYFNDMSKVIDDHGGVVLEFIGDAILCIYGAPLMNPDHPSSAVKASLRMLASLRRMNDWSLSKKLPEVQIRCGVHTGTVLVGNMGFHSRMKYGIVGEDAHIPSRLEENNKTYGTNLMISQATYKQLDPNALFIIRPLDYVKLNTSDTCISEKIYHVMDREKKTSGNKVHPLREPARLHAEAMRHYRTRDFTMALEKFTQVGKLMYEINGKEDGPSQLLANRCLAYIERPPPDTWDGTWDRGS